MDKQPHYHATTSGLVKCYHSCKTALTDWGFWLGVTLSFPLEHYLWEKTPLVWISQWLGL